MKEIKVFIAGSTLLKNEFNTISDALRIVTNRNSKKIVLRPYTYEDVTRQFIPEGHQEKYNSFIKEEADYVIFVIDGEVGGITKKEFDIAWESYIYQGRPGIYVYHKPAEIISKDLQEIIDKFNDCELYYEPYSDLENLKLKVKDSFRLVIDEYEFYFRRLLSKIMSLGATAMATIKKHPLINAIRNFFGLYDHIIIPILIGFTIIVPLFFLILASESVGQAQRGNKYFLEEEYTKAVSAYNLVSLSITFDAAYTSDALCNLASCYEIGVGTSKDLDKAFKTYLKVAKKQYPRAIEGIISLFKTKKRTIHQYKETIECLQNVAHNDNEEIKIFLEDLIQELFIIGCDYHHGSNDKEKDNVKAFQYFHLAAKYGHTHASFYLGEYHYHGINVRKNYSKALKWFRKAAEQGNLLAQSRLALMYDKGDGVSKDKKESLKWWRMAAEQGDVNAQIILGYSYSLGLGVAIDYAEAAKWYLTAAEQGEVDAQNKIGDCYYFGKGVQQSFSEAEKWYSMAAKQGNMEAQNNLGDYYYGIEDYKEAEKWYFMAAEQGHIDAQMGLGNCYYFYEKDYAESIKWYCQSAEQGSLLGIFMMGVMYENGEGVEKDIEKAKKWYYKAANKGYKKANERLNYLSTLDLYEKGQDFYYGRNNIPQDYVEALKYYSLAAESGNCDAQFALSLCYYYGRGCRQDYLESVKWCRKAAEQNHAEAQLNLGLCYALGHGVDKDYLVAVNWFKIVADQGNALAQTLLGNHYYSGIGVRQDYSEAVKWFRKAGEQNHADAQYSLGHCYEHGQGVEKNLSEAKKWYQKAAEQGHADAKKCLSN